MSFIKYCLGLLLFILAHPVTGQEIKWLTWEQAAAANEKAPRKLFVDIYTDWCGWCKRMDATTFKDPAIVELINKEFYAIKLNAEQKDIIKWRGEEFKWFPGGRDGVHKLAYDLLDGKMSYPSYILMDASFSRILISPGYKAGDVLIKELKYAAGDHYKTTSWTDFKARS